MKNSFAIILHDFMSCFSVSHCVSNVDTDTCIIWIISDAFDTRENSLFLNFSFQRKRDFFSLSSTSSAHAVWRLVSKPTWTKSKYLFGFVVCGMPRLASQPIIIIIMKDVCFVLKLVLISEAESERLNTCSSHMFDTPRFFLILLIPWSFDVREVS